MKIRGQHYVWRHYLEPWTTDGSVWCRRRGEIFKANPAKVGKQRDFYRLRELTDTDVLVAQAFIAKSPEHVRPLHTNLLRTFALIPRLRHLGAEGLKDDTLLAELDDAVINTEELLHGRIERHALDQLNSLRQGDTSFYDNDAEVADFLYFLSVQYMRTRQMRETVVSGMAARALGPYADISRIWNLLSHVFATNIGWSLYLERKLYRPVILIAEGGAFITGDQPIINTLGRHDGTEPEDLEYYYPLTPSRALLLTKQHNLDANVIVDRTETARFNQLIEKFAQETLFAVSAEHL